MTKVRWEGNEALRPLLAEIGALHRDPGNARVHGDRSLSVISTSYQRWGQQKPIVALENGKIIAGNGQHEAATRLGWTHIAVVRFLNPEEAKAFALTDNRSAELSIWDYDVLSEDFTQLVDIGEDLEALGWSAHEQRPEWMQDGRAYEARTFGRSIPLTTEQRAIFDQAARAIREGDTADEVSDGRVVELLAAEFLAGA